jgi:hypothetical protein
MEIKQKAKTLHEKIKISLTSNHKWLNFDYVFKLVKIILVRSILAIIIGFLISFYVIKFY